MFPVTAKFFDVNCSVMAKFLDMNITYSRNSIYSGNKLLVLAGTKLIQTLVSIILLQEGQNKKIRK